jgi:hypothetical protein
MYQAKSKDNNELQPSLAPFLKSDCDVFVNRKILGYSGLEKYFLVPDSKVKCVQISLHTSQLGRLQLECNRAS